MLDCKPSMWDVAKLLRVECSGPIKMCCLQRDAPDLGVQAVDR